MCSEPLVVVSCIMPTRGRPDFAVSALEDWRRQTWPARELIILDDADARSFSSAPGGDCVRYILLPSRRSIGAKRNIAASHARGQIICHWDDDDRSAPGRIADQLNRLLASGCQVTGYNEVEFVDQRGRRWIYKSPPDYAVGSSLMYYRDFWINNPFPDVDVGEDNAFVTRARALGTLVVAPARGMLLASIHDGNTSPRNTCGSNWVVCA